LQLCTPTSFLIKSDLFTSAFNVRFRKEFVKI
jgi:hypothetical protein